MIVNMDFYKCNNCKEYCEFDTSKPHSKLCPKCGQEMELWLNADCDPDKPQKPPYDPTKDPKSPYYRPTVECPYCHSTNTAKITFGSKAAHTAVFGIFSMGRNSKDFKCNDCKAEF